MDRHNLFDFDADGALQETAAAADAELKGHTRRRFLGRAGVAGGALAGGGALLGGLAPAASAGTGGHGQRYERGRPPSSYGSGDVGVLNFALALEYLEAAFYNEAKRNGAITDPATMAFLNTVERDENAHVRILKSALGSKAIKSPTFNFQGIPENQSKFQQTAYTLENTGVHAYIGQTRNIYSPAYLTIAAGIATVEGRHAAIIGSILSDTTGRIAPNGPVDNAMSANQILTAVGGLGVVTGGLPKGLGGKYMPPAPPEG